jgi:hypothetical protein
MSNFRKAFIFQIQILLTQAYSALDMTLQEPYFVSTNICMQKNSFHEMGGARGAYGGGERCAQGSGGET